MATPSSLAQKMTKPTATPAGPLTWKFVVMGLVPVVSSVLLWWTLHIALLGPNEALTTVERLTQYSVSLAFFCVTLALFGVFAMAAGRKRWWMSLVSGALCSITLLPFFPWRWATLAAVLITLGGYALWSWNVAGDVAIRRKFQPHYTIHAGFGTGLILLLVGVSMCYYTSLGQKDASAATFRENLVNSGRSGIDSLLANQVQGYRGEMTLDEFLGLVATDKLGEFVLPQVTETLDNDRAKQEAYKKLQAELRKLNPSVPAVQTNAVGAELDKQLEAERQALLQATLAKLSDVQRQLLDEARHEFVQTFRIQASGTETMDAIIEKILLRNISTYVDPYEDFLPPLLALSFFFVIELISIIYRYVIFALAPLIAWVYQKMGALRIRVVQADVEEVVV